MISAVIPAKDEASTVGAVVRCLKSNPKITEVIVVDNGSKDGTGELAASAGARVLLCSEPGLGRAMKLGVTAASNNRILRTDADITNLQSTWVDLLATKDEAELSRGYFTTPNEAFPVTNLVVRPFFDLYKPTWSQIPVPLSGTYLLDRRAFDVSNLPDNWAIDIAILTTALSSESLVVENTDLGILIDRIRPIEHYVPMARDIIGYLVNAFLLDAK